MTNPQAATEGGREGDRGGREGGGEGEGEGAREGEVRPRGRESVSGVGSVLTFGGKAAGGALSARLAQFSLDSNHWITLSSSTASPRPPLPSPPSPSSPAPAPAPAPSLPSRCPSARNGHRSFVKSGSSVLFIFGGKGPSSPQSESPVLWNDVHAFNAETNSWEEVTTKGQIPPPRAYFASVLVQDRFYYVMGGVGGFNSLLNDMYRLDLDSMEWQAVPVTGVVPNSRYGHSASFILGHYLLIYGGREKDHKPTNLTSFFDLKTNHYSTVISPLPERFGQVVIAHGSWLLVIGGDESQDPVTSAMVWINLQHFPKISWQFDTSVDNQARFPLGSVIAASATKTPLGLVLFGGRIGQECHNELLLLREKPKAPKEKGDKRVRFGEEHVREHRQQVLQSSGGIRLVLANDIVGEYIGDIKDPEQQHRPVQLTEQQKLQLVQDGVQFIMSSSVEDLKTGGQLF